MPPAIAPSESTRRIDFERGGLPSASSSSPSPPIATMVPIVSKSASISENTSSTIVMTPMFSKDPSRSNWPSSEKSGRAKTPSNFGALLKPAGLSGRAPMCSVFSRITAMTVATRIEMSSAPGTRRTCRMIVSTSPITNTGTGNVPRLPIATMVPDPGVTMPALLSPMRVMNRPIRRRRSRS